MSTFQERRIESQWQASYQCEQATKMRSAKAAPGTQPYTAAIAPTASYGKRELIRCVTDGAVPQCPHLRSLRGPADQP